MNQTVSRIKSVNWRYSDCQFSVTALGEARAGEIAAEGERLRGLAGHLRVPRLEIVVVVPARVRLAGERQQEEDEEGEAETLLADEAPHQ
jgi:hypothetical protein